MWSSSRWRHHNDKKFLSLKHSRKHSLKCSIKSSMKPSLKDSLENPAKAVMLVSSNFDGETKEHAIAQRRTPHAEGHAPKARRGILLERRCPHERYAETYQPHHGRISHAQRWPSPELAQNSDGRPKDFTRRQRRLNHASSLFNKGRDDTV